MAVGTQLGLLLWKNFTYRRRQRVSGGLGWGYPEPLDPGTVLWTLMGTGTPTNLASSPDPTGYRDPVAPLPLPYLDLSAAIPPALQAA